MLSQELADRVLEEARAPLPARDHPLTVTELIGLWHGDEWTTGYCHPHLAYKIVSELRYANIDLLRARFYPAHTRDEVPVGAWRVIQSAWELWERRRKARQE